MWGIAMAEFGLRTRMLVKDVMSSPVVTVDEGETVDKVAQFMEMQRLGCIIVTDEDGRPLGIIEIGNKLGKSTGKVSKDLNKLSEKVNKLIRR